MGLRVAYEAVYAGDPGPHAVRHELGAVIRADVAWDAVQQEQIRQSASQVRGAALRSGTFSFAMACSIGF